VTSANVSVQAEVERELALDHAVDLARPVPVQHRRPSSGGHPDLDREERTVGVGARGENRQLVGSEPESLGCGRIDR